MGNHCWLVLSIEGQRNARWAPTAGWGKKLLNERKVVKNVRKLALTTSRKGYLKDDWSKLQSSHRGRIKELGIGLANRHQEARQSEWRADEREVTDNWQAGTNDNNVDFWLIYENWAQLASVEGRALWLINRA